VHSLSRDMVRTGSIAAAADDAQMPTLVRLLPSQAMNNSPRAHRRLPQLRTVR